MEFGIVGLELAGKTTLFSMLTGSAPTSSRRETRVGMARVPDSRLDHLSGLFQPRKHTPATVRFVDVPGITRGGGAALNLPELRTMDGVLVVVRGFVSEVVPPPQDGIDPARDLELLETELLLADLSVVSARLERLDRELAKRREGDLERELAVLQRCRTALEAGTALRAIDLTSEELLRLRGFTFLTLKPMLVVLNVGEDQASSLKAALDGSGLARWATQPRVALTAVCATLEEEISHLDPRDQGAFLINLGLEERALDRLLRAAYALLGLVSFFTVGDDECRAWPVPAGTPAARAAGTIHSDIERGFIRAETVSCGALLELGSLAACRSRGAFRLEGREYPIQDGDVINFRFNV